MATPSAKRFKLSDRLRNLRFMRQKDETDIRTTLEMQQVEREKEMHWTTGIDLCDGDDGLPAIIIDESIIPFEYQRYFGRRSFGNFNPVVEKRNRAGLAILSPVARQSNLSTPDPVRPQLSPVQSTSKSKPTDTLHCESNTARQSATPIHPPKLPDRHRKRRRNSHQKM